MGLIMNGINVVTGLGTVTHTPVFLGNITGHVCIPVVVVSVGPLSRPVCLRVVKTVKNSLVDVVIFV